MLRNCIDKDNAIWENRNFLYENRRQPLKLNEAKIMLLGIELLLFLIINASPELFLNFFSVESK